MMIEDILKFKIDDHKLVTFWNDFWMILPDNWSIRTQTFFRICDIAEHIFDEDDENGLQS